MLDQLPRLGINVGVPGHQSLVRHLFKKDARAFAFVVSEASALVAAKSRFICFSGRNYNGTCLPGGCVKSLHVCKARCKASPGCVALVGNRYGQWQSV